MSLVRFLLNNIGRDYHPIISKHNNFIFTAIQFMAQTPPIWLQFGLLFLHSTGFFLNTNTRIVQIPAFHQLEEGKKVISLPVSEMGIKDSLFCNNCIFGRPKEGCWWKD